MDGAMQSKRKHLAYTTKQLKDAIERIKAAETGSDACMKVIAMQDEVDRREAGTSPVFRVPQL